MASIAQAQSAAMAEASPEFHHRDHGARSEVRSEGFLSFPRPRESSSASVLSVSSVVSPSVPVLALHDECEEHLAGSFLDAKHFGLLFRYLIARGRHGLAYELLHKAKVFDDYVYVFHGADDSPAALFLRKELPKFFVRGLYQLGETLYPADRALVPR